MNVHTKASLALASLLCVAPFAVQADSGFFVGGSIGSATLDEDFEGFAVDDDTESYRIFAGLQLNDLIAIEGGYQNFGDFEERIDLNGTTSITRLTADGWTLGGTLTLPVSDQVSLFGRAGIFMWDADIELNGIRAAVEDDDNPYYGAGASVALSPNFSLLGDWTRYELDDVDSDVISIGFQYRFGN